MNTLIAELEAATEGSMELDVAVCPYRTKWHDNCEDWMFEEPDLSGAWNAIPAYTTSLDAALTLVPEGWEWLVRGGDDENFANVTRGGVPVMMEGRQINPDWQRNPVYAHSPALALCIAALRARQAMEKKDGE